MTETLKNRHAHDISAILSETNWQRPPLLEKTETERAPSVSLTRWSKRGFHEKQEMVADDANDAHFITFSMKSARIDFTVGSKQVTNGIVQKHRVLLQGPVWEKRQSIYHESFDLFRIYFSQALLAECYESLYGRPPSGDLALFHVTFLDDPVVLELTKALVTAEANTSPHSAAFVESTGLALASWLISKLSDDAGRKVEDLSRSGLSDVRLRRTLEYIDANYSHAIDLTELGAVAGLSRVRFAAQFRRATGTSPHSYVIKRRIDEARKLLANGNLTTADVAFVVGFSSQAHFTSAFRKFVGDTPASWRRKNDLICRLEDD